VKNVVLLAPDIDADVAAAKIFGVVSDPDLTYGAAPQPRRVFPGKEEAAKAARLANLVDFIEVKATAGFFGHSYYTSDPKVSADLVALIRYGLRPGDPGRPLEEIQRPFWRIPAGS
jgi:hypothetical protein